MLTRLFGQGRQDTARVDSPDVARFRFDSQTDPKADADRIAAVARELLHVVCGRSMRVSGNSKVVTHTEPSPTLISPPGPGTPTSIVATTLLWPDLCA